MVPKEHLLFKHNTYTLLIGLMMLLGCAGSTKEPAAPYPAELVDVSRIPFDTLDIKNEALQLENGMYYLDGSLFSGFIKERHDNSALKSITSVYLGKQHGLSKTFYTNGQQRDERMYKENLSYGRHFGYWENGNMKFDFTYYNDKREGLQKQWYYNGQPYALLSFSNDKENGLQQAWRENGKAYINYDAKDGRRYGLQKSALCYTLVDEKLKIKK